MFNNHYINIVKKTSGITPDSLGDFSLPENDEETVNKILTEKSDWTRWYSSKDFKNCKKCHCFTLNKYYK